MNNPKTHSINNTGQKTVTQNEKITHTTEMMRYKDPKTKEGG